MSKKKAVAKKPVAKVATTKKKAAVAKAPKQKTGPKVAKDSDYKNIHNHKFQPADLKDRLMAKMHKDHPFLNNFTYYLNCIVADFLDGKLVRQG